MLVGGGVGFNVVTWVSDGISALNECDFVVLVCKNSVGLTIIVINVGYSKSLDVSVQNLCTLALLL